MDVPAPSTYVLSGIDRERWMRAYLKRTQPRRGLASLASLILALNFVIRGLWHSPHAREMLLFLSIALAATGAFITIHRLRERRRAETITFALEPKGIEYTRDSDTERVAWYAVKAAYAFEDFYAIERRDDRKPILVPAAAIVHTASFWSFLEVRLEGGHARLRDLGFPAPQRLTNKLDQYLADHATA